MRDEAYTRRVVGAGLTVVALAAFRWQTMTRLNSSA